MMPKLSIFSETYDTNLENTRKELYINLFLMYNRGM